jgi:type IV secretory pathway VirB4 component
MLNLGEYRQKSDRLADHLPWAALVAPGVILNKDGSFLRCFRFRGPDLESATQSELVAACARVNNVMRRFGSGWATFFEAERFPAPGYPVSEFPDDATWLVDEERRAQFESGGAVADAGKRANRPHFETAYYLTLLFMPPADNVASAERVLIETPDDKSKRDWRYELAAFHAETERAHDLLGQVLAEITPLDDAQTLTYLHGTISTKRHQIRPPETPMYLDGLLADTSLRGGLDPMLGDTHLRCPARRSRASLMLSIISNFRTAGRPASLR